jgi:hypothetical protein
MAVYNKTNWKITPIFPLTISWTQILLYFFYFIVISQYVQFVALRWPSNIQRGNVARDQITQCVWMYPKNYGSL